ncbi:MAG TPA: hypothetical protein VF297_26095 [Pyrinomonadaceae bacterium]
MNLSETLTKLVVGMGRLGEYLLKRKLSGIVAAVSAFALGLAAWGLLARTEAPACSAPLVVEVRNETGRGKYESVAYETCRGEASAEGRYENERYGFSIGLSPGVSGAGSHGLGLGFDNPRSTELNRRLDDAVNDRLKLLRAEGDGTVRLLSKSLTSLGGLPAARVVAAYEKGGARMVSDQIIAFKREEGGAAVAVVYTIDLSTTLDNYERDRPVLEAMRQTWHLQPPR